MRDSDPERTKEPPDLPAEVAAFALIKKRRRGFPRYLLPTYLLLIIYVSLSPFSGWRMPENETFHFFWASWPRYITAFDVLANVLAYVPLAILLFELARRRLGPGAAAVSACIGGCLLSFSMETLQAYLPVRISSPVDFLANSAGTIGGAVLAALVGRSALARWAVNWRYRTFSESPGSEFGEVLLAVWLFIQLNPSIPFFAAGTINSSLAVDWNGGHYQPPYLLPQSLAVALNFCGFGLFISVLLNPPVRILRFVVGAIAVGVFLKILAAGALLKPPLMLDWFGKNALIGVLGGLALLILTKHLRHRWRIYMAAMMILAGGLLAKIAAIYEALSNTLSVFDWSHGQLFNFTSLTLLLNEFWPLVTFIYLLIAFSRLPRASAA